MTDQNFYSPNPGSKSQPHCLSLAAPVGRRLGYASRSGKGRWWR
jgi:hypothetical protein